MCTPNYKTGFTLIELLVVISIIGLMSSLVLAALQSAREKAANSAIIQSLVNAQSQAELFYYANDNSYGPLNPAITGQGNVQNVCQQGATAGSVSSIYRFLQAAHDIGGFGQPIDTSLSAGATWNKVVCNVNTGENTEGAGPSWIATAPLKDSTPAQMHIFCVDSLGTKQEMHVAPGGSFASYLAWNCNWIHP